jgi:hypothetical protein
MWSHVATVSGDKSLIEATAAGVLRSEFFRLAEPNLDVGLYRLRQSLTPEQVEKMIAFLESKVGAATYNWCGVIRIYF